MLDTAALREPISTCVGSSTTLYDALHWASHSTSASQRGSKIPSLPTVLEPPTLVSCHRVPLPLPSPLPLSLQYRQSFRLNSAFRALSFNLHGFRNYRLGPGEMVLSASKDRHRNGGLGRGKREAHQDGLGVTESEFHSSPSMFLSPTFSPRPLVAILFVPRAVHACGPLAFHSLVPIVLLLHYTIDSWQ